MNNLINLETIDNVLTMSSLEMVKFINSTRVEGDAVLAHSDFLKKVPQVLGEIGAGKFSGTYLSSQNKELPCYYFPKREACLMAMSYSYELQAAIFDRWQELEAQQPQFKELTREQKMAYALISASEIIEEQKAEIKQLSASLKVEHQIANIARAAVVMGDADIQLTKFAKSIEDSFTRDNGAPLGRTTFYKILRDWYILTQDNLATGYARARKWALVKQSGYYMRGDKKVPNLICYITPKGQEYVINRLYQDKEQLGLTIKEYN